MIEYLRKGRFASKENLIFPEDIYTSRILLIYSQLYLKIVYTAGDLEKSEKKCADLKHEHDEMMAELGDL